MDNKVQMQELLNYFLNLNKISSIIQHLITITINILILELVFSKEQKMNMI